MSVLMGDDLIELGLTDNPAGNPKERTAPKASTGLNSFVSRLLAVISSTTVESDSLNTKTFRATLEKYRLQLEQSEGDPNIAAVADECLQFCRDYLVRARRYLLEREIEFAELIDVMRIALGKLAGEAKAFNLTVKGSSERINRLTEIEDIRELKHRIYEEVLELDRVVNEKQKQDELNHARLSRRIEILQVNLAHSKQEAAIDPLTRIANRGSFDSSFEQWIQTHRENGEPFVLCMLDLDDFKRINDEYGHQIGDRVLFCAAQWLSKCVRSTDFLARYGGEEFVIMLRDVTLPQADSRFTEMLSKMAACKYAFSDGNRECVIGFTASCGLAEFNLDETADELLRRADEALYSAKKTGKNRVAVAKTQKSLWKALVSRGLPRMSRQ